MQRPSKHSRPIAEINGQTYELDIRMCPLLQQHKLRARHVLDDAAKALQMLENIGNDMVAARIHYFAVIALLRTVGHVLDKADSTASDNVRQHSSGLYKTMKAAPEDYPIFFDFIEAERNLMLKEYRPGAEMTTLVPILIDSIGNEQRADIDMFPMFVFEDGPFSGQDARDVAADAIAFWDQHLGQIELSSFGESFAQGYRGQPK